MLEAEYAIDLEIRKFADNSENPVIYEGLMPSGFYRYSLPDRVELARLPVGPREEFSDLINTLYTDLFDALGVRLAAGPRIDVEL